MRRRHRAVSGGLALLVVPLLAAAHGTTARAEVTAFEVLSEEPYGAFAPGDYVRVTGRVTGEIGTSEPIPDLERADADGDGRLAYTTDLTLIVPVDPGAGNGTLLVDVANRGLPIAHALYNRPRGALPSADGLGVGTGFLQERGFLLAVPSWELGREIELPTFVDDAGVTRHIEAVGLAAVRDVAAWLRGIGSVEAEGAVPNPLTGAVERALAVGYSQTARLLKTFLLHGFNGLDGERVFDGMHLQAGHAGLLPILRSGTGPGSAANPFPTFGNPDLRGVHEPPFTYREIVREAAARHGGAEPPRLAVTNMANDYYSLRASLARTGPAGTEDVPPPDNVRMYDVAGGSHALLPGLPGCERPRGDLDWHPVMRAVLLHLDRWVRDGTPPPASRLMPLTAAADPADSPAVLGAPPSAPAAVVQVPRVDADGNHLGGVRLPDIEAPLGTYVGQNGPLADVLCTLSGAFIPFAGTEAEREAAGDRRASLRERYAGHGDYVRRVERAARSLVEEGFMLPEDAAVAVQAAEAQGDLFR